MTEVISAAPVADDRDLGVTEQARAAVHVGLWASAARCVLTYVIAPALGALGFFLGPFGLLLQVLGAITATAGARRLWPTRHRLRTPYAAVAVVITLLTLVELLRPVVRGVLQGVSA